MRMFARWLCCHGLDVLVAVDAWSGQSAEGMLGQVPSKMHVHTRDLAARDANVLDVAKPDAVRDAARRVTQENVAAQNGQAFFRELIEAVAVGPAVLRRALDSNDPLSCRHVEPEMAIADEFREDHFLCAARATVRHLPPKPAAGLASRAEVWP